MTKFSCTCSQLVRGIVVILICACTALRSTAQIRVKDSLVTSSKDFMVLKDVFDDLRKFGYIPEPNNSVDLTEVVYVRCTNMPLEQFLKMVFRGKPVGFMIQGRHIGFRREEPVPVRMPIDTIPLLRGIVIDMQGRPIHKASVRLNHPERGKTTDVNGGFEFSYIKIGTLINVTCIGREPYIGYVPADTFLHIRLEEQTDSVKEYEVTGNKVTKPRKDSTYYFPPLNTVTMKGQNNLMNDLEGKVPGVLVQPSNGRSGSTINTEIRGPTSLNRSSQALYIIDGVILPPEFKGGEGTMSQYSSTLSYFSPADIDTIIVLKSAVATALYGARGANGVVLIFTRKTGYTDKTSLIADVSYGLGHVTRREQLLNTEQYIRLRWDAWENDGLPPTNAKAQDMLVWEQHHNTDWQKKLIGNTAYYRDATLTMTGGGKAIQYRIGGNYRSNSTVYMREGNEHPYGDRKFGLNASADMKGLKDRMVVLVTGLANINQTRLPGIDYTAGISLPPNAPPLFENGKINYALNNSIVSMPDFKGRVSNLLTTANLSYQVNSVISFKIMAGYHQMGARTTSIMTIARRGEEGQGNIKASSSESRYQAETFVIAPSADIDLRKDSHRLVLTTGVTYNSIYARNRLIDAKDFKRDKDILDYDAGTITKDTATRSRYKYAGAYAHLNYDWKGKYTLELILRVDGSSRFGKDEQVNTYGGGAAGWEFGKETFIRHAFPGLSYGRIQVGWSATGNDQIEDYQYAGSYQPAGSYQSVEGLMAAKQQNSALTGGITYKKDLTVNLGIFNNRLEIEAAYYQNRSKHQLVEYPLPEMAGGGTIQRNMPVAIQNNGVELTLNARLVQRKHWELAARFNVSSGTNMLLSYPGMLSAPVGQTQLKRPLRELYYYDFYGVDPKTGGSLYRNRSGAIVNAAALTENDRTIPVNTTPQFYGGFGFTLTVHGFELTCAGQYMKRTAEDATIDKQHMVGTMWNQNVYVLERWRMIGDYVHVPKATQASSSEADFKKHLNSTAMFMNVWYVRMNNLTLAKQFGRYRVYGQASNLFTITNYRSLDPETLSRTSLPFLRIIRTGVQYHLK